MAMGRPWRVVLVVVVALWASVGIAWILSNLGEIPEYGDTGDYLRLARTLKVDSYRGIAYPALLAATERVLGLVDLEASPAEFRRYPRELFPVQLCQLAACLASLMYLLVLLGGVLRPDDREGVTGGRLGYLLLLALVFLDPLVAHFNLSIMTDALALACSLALCCALVDLRARRVPAWLSGTVLVVTTVLISSLRVEKGWVVLGTVVVTLCHWGIVGERGETKPTSPPARTLIVAVLVALSLCTTLVIRWSARGNYGRWPPVITVVHDRIIYPNLSAEYDHLPERVRRVVSLEDAEVYDQHINKARRVMNTLTRGNPELLRQLTEDMAWTIGTRRWGRILLDILRDTTENVLATISFYVRVATYSFGGRELIARWFPSDGTIWTYTRLAAFHPRLSRLWLACSAVMLVAGLALAGSRWLALLRGRERVSESFTSEIGNLVVPFVAFVVLNALVFALKADLTFIRYTIFAHTVLITVVYHAALQRLAQWGVL